MGICRSRCSSKLRRESGKTPVFTIAWSDIEASSLHNDEKRLIASILRKVDNSNRVDKAKVYAELLSYLRSRKIDQLCNDIVCDVTNDNVFPNLYNIAQNLDKTTTNQKMMPTTMTSHQYCSKEINKDKYNDTKSDKNCFENENEIKFDTSINSQSNFETIGYGNEIQPSTRAAGECQRKTNLTSDYDRWVKDIKLEIAKQSSSNTDCQAKMFYYETSFKEDPHQQLSKKCSSSLPSLKSTGNFPQIKQQFNNINYSLADSLPEEKPAQPEWKNYPKHSTVQPKLEPTTDPAYESNQSSTSCQPKIFQRESHRIRKSLTEYPKSKPIQLSNENLVVEI